MGLSACSYTDVTKIDIRPGSTYENPMKSLLFACLMPLLAAVAADAPASFKVSDYTFERPANWESVPPASSMRKAQLRVRAEKGDGADVVFFHFGPGDGGGTKANIDRWLAQFTDAKDPKVANEAVGTHKVIYVSTRGSYSGGMPGQDGARFKDYALLGAIIESDTGNVFIKMTGPEKVVKSAEADFRKMVTNALK